ncbi:MAG: calcium-binding protein [Pseudomonadota bacterium]
MTRLTFTGLGGVLVSDPDKLVGITDLEVVQTSQGEVLYATGRGGSYLTSIDLGPEGYSSDVTEHWKIPTSFLQIESAEILSLPVPQGDAVFLLGLASADLEGRLVSGDDIQGGTDLAAGSFDMGGVADISFNDDDVGLAILRGGGVMQVSLKNGTLVAETIPQGGALAQARASDVHVFTSDGTDYAIVSYGTSDALALFKLEADGDFVHVQDIEAGDGFWIDAPGAMASITGLDGQTYVIVAASGSSSLTVLTVEGGALVPVDHRIDSLETRFADASFVETVEIDGRPYVVAAGSDMGVTVFGLMPGGALVEVGSLSATAETPINGIMDLEVIAQPGGARFVIATQGAPYIVEFEMTFDAPGVTQLGTAGSNSLSGGSGDDWLFGEAGNDTLVGGAGNDLLTDGSGQDVLTGGAGADVFQLGLDGSGDTITDFNPDEDLIEIIGLPLGSMNDVDLVIRWWGIEITIEGELFSVYSEAGGGIPWTDIQGGALVFSEAVSVDATDYLFDAPDYGPESGSDLDPTQLAGAPPPDVLSGSQPSIEGFNESFRIITSGNDSVWAASVGEAIDGAGGQDIINGQAGSDTLVGGGGFDTIDGGGGHDRLSGGVHADSVYGGWGNDWIVGGQGFDQLFGEGGHDSLWGGAEPDRMYGGDGNDWISAGTNYGYTVDGVFGEAGNDTLFGDGGFDLLEGGDGNDALYGGDQADNLYGGAGSDVLVGGQGFDRLFGGDGNDSLDAGEGSDGLFGDDGDDFIWGGIGDDRFYSGNGDDIADGGEGNDVVRGNAGFDTIIGGTGDDELWGNFNADRFVFADGHGDDVIVDFEATNVFEVLDFSALSLFQSTSDVMAAAVQVGADVVINTGGGNSITLEGVKLDDLDGTDFLF